MRVKDQVAARPCGGLRQVQALEGVLESRVAARPCGGLRQVEPTHILCRSGCRSPLRGIETPTECLTECEKRALPLAPAGD